MDLVRQKIIDASHYHLEFFLLIIIKQYSCQFLLKEMNKFLINEGLAKLQAP